MFLRKKIVVRNVKTTESLKMGLKTASNNLNVKSVGVDL